VTDVMSEVVLGSF